MKESNYYSVNVCKVVHQNHFVIIAILLVLTCGLTSGTVFLLLVMWILFVEPVGKKRMWFNLDEASVGVLDQMIANGEAGNYNEAVNIKLTQSR